jgi:serine/threonine protein kinase
MISICTSRILFRFSQVPKKALKANHPDDYEVMYSLGKGSSARVFLGFNVLSNKKYVVKIFKKSHE